MQDEQDEAVEPTAEDTTADAEGAADDGPSGEDADTAATVDQSASAGGADSGVLQQAEVPDDSNERISAAQEHINRLDMDAEREAAERAAKNT